MYISGFNLVSSVKKSFLNSYKNLGSYISKYGNFYGKVASINRHQVAIQIPQPNSKGYLFDGVCDGLAVVFVLLGLGFWILRESTTPGRHKTR